MKRHNNELDRADLRAMPGLSSQLPNPSGVTPLSATQLLVDAGVAVSASRCQSCASIVTDTPTFCPQDSLWCRALACWMCSWAHMCFTFAAWKVRGGWWPRWTSPAGKESPPRNRAVGRLTRFWQWNASLWQWIASLWLQSIFQRVLV